MYTLVNGLQGGLHMPQPRFRHRKQIEKEKSPSKSCCEILAEKVRTFCLELRAGVLVILVVLGLPGFYLTLNFLLNPGLATLRAQFKPATCIVASSTFKMGQVNCTWSSCRQGCTRQELYTCWQVLVVPRWGELNLTGDSMVNESSVENTNFESTNPKIELALSSANISSYDDGDESFAPETNGKAMDHDSGKREFHTLKTHQDGHKEESNQTINEDGLARLKINAAGCDYTPCDAWCQKYGKLGMMFPCYVGNDGRLAVPEFDAEHTAVQVTVGVLPLVLGIVSFCLMYWLYCRKGHTDKTLSLSPERSAKKSKMDQIRAKLIMVSKLKKKEPGQKKLGNMWTFALNSRNMAKIRPAEGNGTAFDKAGVWGNAKNNPNITGKLDPLEHWRSIAVMASLHPTVSPGRRFKEVEIDFNAGKGNTGTSHSQHEPSDRLSWSDEYLIQDIDDDEDC
ncbi:protein tipE-like [Palaemon carinicauda]|uniref:protein tipE-like n=1 Tax=Palaemon carinicauda TaxID=392227 RepID=UPI0035B658A7